MSPKRAAPKIREVNLALEGTLLPPPKAACQKCAVEHAPEQPHNQQSMFWQYWFYKSVNGERWPTWRDAMAHCAPEVQAFWTDALKARGVDIDGPGNGLKR